MAQMNKLYQALVPQIIPVSSSVVGYDNSKTVELLKTARLIIQMEEKKHNCVFVLIVLMLYSYSLSSPEHINTDKIHKPLVVILSVTHTRTHTPCHTVVQCMLSASRLQ